MRPSSPLLDSVRDLFEGHDQMARDFAKAFVFSKEFARTDFYKTNKVLRLSGNPATVSHMPVCSEGQRPLRRVLPGGAGQGQDEALRRQVHPRGQEQAR